MTIWPRSTCTSVMRSIRNLYGLILLSHHLRPMMLLLTLLQRIAVNAMNGRQKHGTTGGPFGQMIRDQLEIASDICLGQISHYQHSFIILTFPNIIRKYKSLQNVSKVINKLM